MFLNIIYIIAGVVLVLWGADRMTDGASSLARRMTVPEILIGLTVVAAGTSAPELFVSLVSALKGTPDLAVGNVVGSNILNTMLIVGCTAMVAPMAISRSTVRKDIPFAVAASLLLFVLCMDGFGTLSLKGNMISRTDGLVLLAGLAAFMGYTVRLARKEVPVASHVTSWDDGGDVSATPVTGNVVADTVSTETPVSLWKCILLVIVGLACLIFGSNLFVDAASAVAATLGVSESVVGLTIVAGGTSLPELATSVVAARKGQSALAIGNVLGSNVFNILAILGVTAVLCPMQISGITITDLLVMIISIAVVWMFSFTRYTVERWEGAVLVCGYAGYMWWLL